MQRARAASADTARKPWREWTWQSAAVPMPSGAVGLGRRCSGRCAEPVPRGFGAAGVVGVSVLVPWCFSANGVAFWSAPGGFGVGVCGAAVPLLERIDSVSVLSEIWCRCNGAWVPVLWVGASLSLVAHEHLLKRQKTAPSNCTEVHWRTSWATQVMPSAQVGGGWLSQAPITRQWSRKGSGGSAG